ncbi:diacylglycerol kinase family protein [Shewanella gaetbuli]
MLKNINIKYYYTFAALTTAVLAAVVHPWWLTLLLAWVSLSLTLVSVAYWFNAAGIFRKKTNGTIPWYISWSFVPFLLGCQLYNAWARKHDKVPAIQQIDNQLYLACRLFPQDVDYLKEQNVTAVLDVTAEFDALDLTLLDENIDYLNIPVLDHSVPTVAQLNQAVNWLYRQQREGKSVVVHCALGRGRSVLVLASYLACRRPSLSLETILKSINDIRSTAGLNRWQLAKLAKLHAENKVQIHQNAYLVANPVSGGGKWQCCEEEVLESLSQYYDVTLLKTTEKLTATELATRAVNQGADMVIACGGDGTVNEVASVLTNTQAALGIIPMGTTNALAHTLFGIGSKLVPVSTALDILTRGQVAPIDTAKCNDNIVLLMVGVGFGHKMIESANRERKNESGQFAYLNGLWQAVSENKPLKLSLQVNGEQAQTIETTSVVIANSAPFTSLLAQGNGEPDITDGQLDITWIAASESSPEQFLSLAELMFNGILGKEENQTPSAGAINHLQATKVKVSAQQPLSYVIDGELFEADEISVEVLPKSLNVLVPEDSPIFAQ